MPAALAKKIKFDIERFEDFKTSNVVTDPRFTPEAKQERIERCRGNFFEFVRVYNISGFKHFNKMHHWMADRFYKPGLWAIAGSRFFAKTSIFRFFELFNICYPHYKFVAVVSEHKKLARKNLKAIKKICESPAYKLLQYDYNFTIHEDSETEELTINGILFAPYSYESSSRGELSGESGFDRPDLILVDDLEKFKSSRNPDINRAKKDAVSSEFFLSMDTHGTLFWLGNNLRSNCALALHLKEHIDDGTCLVFPALNKEGKSNWPEVYPTKEIEHLMETVGPISASTEMQQVPINGNGLYREEWLIFDEYRHFKDKLVEVIQWHDPAFSKKSEACFRACATVGIDENDRFYILSIRCSHTTYLDFFEECYQDYVNYNASTFYYENNGKQWDQKVQDEWDLFPKKSLMTIMDDYSEGEKIGRISGKGLVHIQNKNVTINSAIESHPQFQEWLLQYLDFPNKKLDALDATTGAFIKIKGHNTITKPYRPRTKRVSFYDQ